jgi:hypothetical protein
MAVQHIEFNDSTKYGAKLRQALTSLEIGLEQLIDVRDVMGAMIDGDGSQAAHFAYATTKFSFPSDAATKAAYDELNSVLGKLTTDGSVTFVNAALLQVFKKLR